MFADDYGRFIEISEESGESTPEERERQRARFNERYRGLIESNRDILTGARVLDLACHDGRYAFAALKTGAAHATGVEARQSLLDRGQAAYAHYGQDPSTYRFVSGDLYDVLEREKFDADVVLSFGFLYHTYRHTEFMYYLHRMRPKYLIMDTMVTLDPKPTLKMIREVDTEDNRSAAIDRWSPSRVLVLRPSLPALELLMRSYGFEVESMHDWPAQLAGRGEIPGTRGYASGKRVTLRCRFKGTGGGAGRAAAFEIPEWWPTVKPSEPAPVPEPTGWRAGVNQVMTRTTGLELRRAGRS